MLNKKVPFPKTMFGRLFLAFCICVCFPLFLLYSNAIIQTIQHQTTSQCGYSDSPYPSKCSPLDGANATVLLVITLIILTGGVPIIAPTAILWLLFEIASYVSRKRLER